MKVKGLLFGAVLSLAAVGPAQAFLFNTPNPHVFEAPFGSLFDTRLLNLDAQVSYDCWIEAASGARAGDAETCKAAFLGAMAEVDRWADHSLSAFDVVAVAAPGVVADQAYLVYFDFDRADLLPEGFRAIDDILAAAAAEPDLTVRIVAHTDTVGGLDYNQALSERRANAVILSLIQGGLNRSRIISEPVGETRLMVDTDDDVREPANRVAEIDLL
jgi:outer membrane protein OmpA-like peptidoglycan-associated protein